METIKSPDEVSLLMENMWLRHKAGMKQRPNNKYMVELPPPTEEELAEIRRQRCKTNKNSILDYDPEDLYGAWI